MTNRNESARFRGGLLALAIGQLAVGGLVAPAGAEDVTLRTLVRSGQTLPGLPAGVTIAAGPPTGPTVYTINNAGRFVSSGYTSDGAECLISGSVRTVDPGARVVLRGGQTIPGLPADVTLLTSSRRFAISADGRFVIGALLTGPSVSGSTGRAWLTQPVAGGPVAVLARVDDPAPGLPGLRYGFFESLESLPGLGASGRLAFTTRLVGDGVDAEHDSALWTAMIDAPGGATVLAREGEQVAGLGAGVTWGDLGTFILPRVSGAGDVIAVLPINDPGAPGEMFRALVRFPTGAGGGAPVLIARSGTNFAGLALVDISPPPLVTDSGLVLLPVQASGPAGTSLLAGPAAGGGPYRVIAAGGASAPGLPGLSIGAPDMAVLAEDGRASYVGLLSGPGIGAGNDTAVFGEVSPMSAPPASALIAREGSVVPGLPANVQYWLFGLYGRSQRGGSLMQSLLAGLSVNADNDQALLAATASGVAQVVAREGDALAVSPGDSRTIQTLTDTVYADVRGVSGIGEFVVNARFTDGSSALIAGVMDRCRADFNYDGAAGVQDLFDFLAAWFGSAPEADINGLGGVTVQDLFDFLALWFAGCP